MHPRVKGACKLAGLNSKYYQRASGGRTVAIALVKASSGVLLSTAAARSACVKTGGGGTGAGTLGGIGLAAGGLGAGPLKLLFGVLFVLGSMPLPDDRCICDGTVAIRLSD